MGGSLGTIWAELGLRWTKFNEGIQSAVARIRQADRDINTATQSMANRFSTVEERVNASLAAMERFGAIGDPLSRIGRTMSLAVTLPILGASAAAIKFAMDAVESENLFEVSMGNMATAARAWSKDMQAAYGLNEYEARENIATFNVMLDSMGMGEKASFAMARALTQLAYDMASFYNLRPEEAMQKIQSGISGEIEPLKRLGIVLTEAQVEQFAYTNGLAKMGEELNDKQKLLARYGLIMERTSKAQGDLGRTLESPANQLRVLKERVTSVLVTFGTDWLPVVGKAIKVASDFMAMVQKWDPATRRVIAVLALLAAAIGPALVLIGAMYHGLQALSAVKAYLAMRGIPSMVSGLGTLVKALASPVGAILLIIAVLGLLYVAWKNNWGNIQERTQWAIEQIRQAFNRMVLSAQAAWELVKLFFYLGVEGIIDLVLRLRRFMPASWAEALEDMKQSTQQKIADIREELASLGSQYQESMQATADATERLRTQLLKPRTEIHELNEDLLRTGAEADKSVPGVKDLSKWITGFGDAAGKAAAKVKSLAESIRDTADETARRLNLALDIAEKRLKLLAGQAGRAWGRTDQLRAQEASLREQLNYAQELVKTYDLAYQKMAKAKGAQSAEALEMLSAMLDAQLRAQEISQSLSRIGNQRVRYEQQATTLQQSAAMARYAGSSGGSSSVNVVVNNPRPETASESVRRQLLRLQYLGATP